jgi:V8-like Glu-specific endopeptidase
VPWVKILVLLAAAAVSVTMSAPQNARAAGVSTRQRASTRTDATARAAASRIATHTVSRVAQRDTLAFWTSKRMVVAVRQTARAATVPKGIPVAVHFRGVPAIGALFFTTGGKAHYCTASVVNSRHGDLVLTAAHCVYSKANGYVTNVEYVPEYHNGHRPYGGWPVRTITVAAGWRESQDPDLDVAFLTVGPSGTRIQDRTGGLTLGIARWYRETIEVIGYNDTDHRPTRCRTKSFKFRAGQMEFYCHGYWDGTSGGPWIAGYKARTGTGTVIGIIGGYQQGGDYEWASYSPYFGSRVRSLFRQAK